tara:strand:- start:1506 stop:2273 length:768 start_codon:yes stop_codon:yes gene_type:complete
MATIVSYNINGIRSVLRKDFDKWLARCNPDIICLQEIKANEEQFNKEIFENLGYTCYVNSAQKAGYSGVAILSKIKPKKVEYGCGNYQIDIEGRLVRVDFKNYSVLSVYFPSGSSGEKRQEFKFMFLDFFQNYINELKQSIPNLIICGDFNICHKEIDIHNPKRNKNTSGFLIEERNWVTNFLNSGFIDSFRFFHEDGDKYTWWSYRARARQKNLGWRIDYNMVSQSLEKYILDARVLTDVVHSDHCPISLKIKS